VACRLFSRLVPFPFFRRDPFLAGVRRLLDLVSLYAAEVAMLALEGFSR